MQISKSGLSFLKNEEGESLTAYKDCRGILTIGVGHTGPVDDQPISLDMTITSQCSDQLLMADLACVQQVIKGNVKVTLSQNQHDALCCLIFNIGITAFLNSTLLRKLNDHNFACAANEFLKWKRAGKNSGILLARRQRERLLFLS